MIDLVESDRIKRGLEQDFKNYQEIIEDTKIGICITDENGNYVAVNSSYLEITLYRREELIGNNFLMVVPDPKKQELEKMHSEFLEDEFEIFAHFTIVNKKGELVHIDVDAGFNSKINNAPHKVTFIQKSDL